MTDRNEPRLLDMAARAVAALEQIAMSAVATAAGRRLVYEDATGAMSIAKEVAADRPAEPTPRPPMVVEPRTKDVLRGDGALPVAWMWRTPPGGPPVMIECSPVADGALGIRCRGIRAEAGGGRTVVTLNEGTVETRS